MDTDNKKIYELIAITLAEYIDIEVNKFDMEADFSTYEIDSAETADIAIIVEKKFNIKFAYDDYIDWNKGSDVVNTVIKKLVK